MAEYAAATGLTSSRSASTEDATMLAISPDSPMKVAVLGSGMYGRALVSKLNATRRFSVAQGSRHPVAPQVSREDAVRDAAVVFLAVPCSVYADVIAAVQDYMQSDVVIVDISNRPLSTKVSPDSLSNAEALQKVVPPGAAVVKAFNNLASYDLDGGGNGAGVSKRMPAVHIAGDSERAVERISRVVTAMGMIPVAHGPLSSARELESLPHRLFPTWRLPLIIGTIVFVWWLLYSTLSTYVIHGGRGTPSRPWSKYPLSSFMASTGETAITLFALTFLAGPLALIAQVARGNASKPFGKFFGSWLAMRKELGMVAFVFMAAHGIAGAISASHLDDGWKGQAYFVAGIVSFVGFSVLAASSDASVSSAMSWAEFRGVFGFLGAFSLAAGVLHQGMWGWIIKKHIPSPKFWVGGGKVMPIYWLGIILPLFTLLLRAISWSPCIAMPQKKLRGEDEQGLALTD